MYKPPFEITNMMLTRAISITEKLFKIDNYQSLRRAPILRRNSRIKSIHSSLAIEANSLSINQVYDVINGKTVLGSQKEIQEVKNAYKAYDMINEFDAYNEKDLLKAHKIMTELILDRPGEYRDHGEGVFKNQELIFMAPPPNIVSKLMNDLFDWLKNDEDTPLLVKSCVFHYEFVFIHPFSDGNGRIARLWQNVILNKWNPIFSYLPIESQILKYQKEYYDSIDICNKRENSNAFIIFMLRVLDDSLSEMLDSLEKEVNNISDQVNKLLQVMEKDIPYSANELLILLGIKSKETLRGSYLNPAIENGLIKMTLPYKPNSKNQEYIK